MNQPSVTAYSGFSKVSGQIAIERFFALISNPTYEHLILKIGQFIQEGKIKEANYVKRQLPFFTITANYIEKRLPESINGYNDLITIDIDGLTDEQVTTLRPIIEQDQATIGSFLTAKQHGYKIIAHLITPQTEELRQKYLRVESTTYERLEEYHGKIYEITRRHYEQLLDIKVDTSGKDISRGVFASYDPQTFFSSERLDRIEPVTTKIIAPDPVEKPKRRKAKNASVQAIPQEVANINPVTQLEFNKCVASVRRTIRYEEGSHNTFLFELGNKCFKRGLDEAEVKLLAAHRFGDAGKWDTDTPIGNGYTYTSKTKKAVQEKENRIPVIEQVKEFLDRRYRFRRNTLLDRLEFMEISADGTPKGFQAMANKDLNTIFLRLSEAGITYAFNSLKSIIDSDYAPPFDPVKDYFGNLPRWDGIVDHISLLADSIQATDQTYWHEVFRHWLVGMVHCAMGTLNINQQALLLYGKQGKGKSSWTRNLLPPELREYCSKGMVDPRSRSNLLLLSNRIIIDVEEFEGVKLNDLAGLKRMISQESVTLRRPYDIQARTYPRRASFIGSTNNARFLNDIGGSRRFLVVHVTDIDYRRKIDYEGLYSQVMYLIENGYQHWFEGEEIDAINERNEQHRMKDPLEENLYVYFRPAAPRDYMVKWKPAAAILSYLSMAGRTQANAQSQELLVQVLERDGFMKRTNEYGITEYGVIVLTMTEMEGNAKRIE